MTITFTDTQSARLLKLIATSLELSEEGARAEHEMAEMLRQRVFEENSQDINEEKEVV